MTEHISSHLATGKLLLLGCAPRAAVEGLVKEGFALFAEPHLAVRAHENIASFVHPIHQHEPTSKTRPN